jgi:Ni,Fe-hydrogenase III small subunit
VSFARSPRHAQVMLLSGALCAQTRASVERMLDAVPEPRVLVAVGDCAIDGCVFRGSPGLDASLAETLDVHVEIPGCPPTPAAVLDAIAEAKRLLMGEDVAADEAAEADESDQSDEAEAEADDDDVDTGTEAAGPAPETDLESDDAGEGGRNP